MGINLSHDACARDPQTLQFDWELVSKNGNVTLRGTYEPLSVNGTDLDFAFFRASAEPRRRSSWRFIRMQEN
jgi:hypothetical protein